MDDLADGLDQSTQYPQAPDIPAVANSPDGGLEYNMVPQDVYVQPALVDVNDPINNVMPGAQAASSSAGTLSPAAKDPSASSSPSFFSDSFKSLSNVVSGVANTSRLASSPSGNVGAQGNVPPVNDSLSISNKGLETVTSSYDQLMSWGAMLGVVAPVAKKTVVTPKVAAKNSNMALYAGIAVAVVVGIILLR